MEQKACEKKPHYRLVCLIAPVNSELAKMAGHIQSIHSDESHRSESAPPIRKLLDHNVHSKKKWMSRPSQTNCITWLPPYLLCCFQLGETLNQLNLEIQSILFGSIIHAPREKHFRTVRIHPFFSPNMYSLLGKCFILLQVRYVLHFPRLYICTHINMIELSFKRCQVLQSSNTSC